MLAARSAWTILRAEHMQLRQRLESIAECLRAAQWSEPEQSIPSLRRQIETLQAFDVELHRPKGIAMVEALRGRSPETDHLLTAFEQGREQDDALLAQALGMLDAIARGEASNGLQCAAVLGRYRESVLHHLDLEDSLLCAHSEQLLTEEEWSRVVSAISSELYSTKPRPGGEDGDSESLP